MKNHRRYPEMQCPYILQTSIYNHNNHYSPLVYRYSDVVKGKKFLFRNPQWIDKLLNNQLMHKIITFTIIAIKGPYMTKLKWLCIPWVVQMQSYVWPPEIEPQAAYLLVAPIGEFQTRKSFSAYVQPCATS